MVLRRNKAIVWCIVRAKPSKSTTLGLSHLDLLRFVYLCQTHLTLFFNKRRRQHLLLSFWQATIFLLLPLSLWWNQQRKLYIYILAATHLIFQTYIHTIYVQTAQSLVFLFHVSSLSLYFSLFATITWTIWMLYTDNYMYVNIYIVKMCVTKIDYKRVLTFLKLIELNFPFGVKLISHNLKVGEMWGHSIMHTKRTYNFKERLDIQKITEIDYYQIQLWKIYIIFFN